MGRGTTSSDRIELRGLRFLARCGVLPQEQAQDQPFEADLDVVCDLAPAGRSDDLVDTVDYGSLCDVVVTAAGPPAALLEHLATRMADAVLGSDPRTVEVTVAVRKLRPPVAHDLGSSGVRITRWRG